MSLNPIDLDILRSGSGNTFFAQLTNSPQNLNQTSIQPFFQISTDLLKSDNLSQLANIEIIKALIRTISASQLNLETFVDLNLCETLPFRKSYLQEPLLDLIYIIASYCPRGITQPISQIFGHLISRFPKKCLTILSIIGERFQIILDPWPVIDLLFTHSNYFSSDSCAMDYISLLVYLNSTFHGFREARQRHCWDAICNLFNKNHNHCIVKYGYTSLAHIYECNPEIISTFPFPPTSIQHLQYYDLQYSVISLLFRMPPNGLIEPIIKEMINLSKYENSGLCQCQNEAGIALILMASDRLCSQVLARDVTWINYNLPTISNTIRLLAQVIKFNPCRRFISINSNLPVFLNRILNELDENDLSSAGFLANQLLISPRNLSLLRNEHFISNYFEKVINDRHPSIKLAYATSLLCESIAKFGESVELNRDVCNFITDAVQIDDEKLNQAASKAAAQLALIPRCARVFKDDGLNEYFSTLSENETAMLFLNNYNEAIFQNMNDRFPPSQRKRRQFRKKLAITIRNINQDLDNENESSDSQISINSRNEEEMLNDVDNASISESDSKSFSDSYHKASFNSESKQNILFNSEAESSSESGSKPKLNQSQSESGSNHRSYSESSSEAHTKSQSGSEHKQKSHSGSEHKLKSSSGSDHNAIQSHSESSSEAQLISHSGSEHKRKSHSLSSSEPKSKSHSGSENNRKSYSESGSEHKLKFQSESESGRKSEGSSGAEHHPIQSHSESGSEHKPKSQSKSDHTALKSDNNSERKDKSISDSESDKIKDSKRDYLEKTKSQSNTNQFVNTPKDDKLDLMQQTDEKECKSEPGNQSEPDTTPRIRPRTSSYRFFNKSSPFASPHSPHFIPPNLPPPNIDRPGLLPTGSLLKSNV